MKKMDAFAVVATGPSLDEDTVEFIKNKYSDIICVSDSYKLFQGRFCAIVASDAKWWDYHKPSFEGYKFCLSEPRQYDLKKNDIFKNVSNTTNSALFGLIVAVDFFNAQEVDLFGVDMSNKCGDHFFGTHPAGLKNSDEKSFERFKKQFAQYERQLNNESHVKVINRNPASGLNVFEKRGLYD